MILYFGGDQHDSGLNASGDVDHTRLFDCTIHAITTVTGRPATAISSAPATPSSRTGASSRQAAGGTRNWGGGGDHPSSHFIGLRDAWLFDPATELWQATGKLVTQRAEEVVPGRDIEKTGGKWYPTLVTLPDGRVLALSGHPEITGLRGPARYDDHPPCAAGGLDGKIVDGGMYPHQDTDFRYRASAAIANSRPKLPGAAGRRLCRLRSPSLPRTGRRGALLGARPAQFLRALRHGFSRQVRSRLSRQ